MVLQGASSKAILEHLDVIMGSHEVSRIEEEYSWKVIQDCMVETARFASTHDCFLDKRPLYIVLKEIMQRMESRGYADHISDQLVELLIQVQKGNQECDVEARYIMYDITDHLEFPIIVKTLKNHNQVGAKLWEASLFIVEVCFHLRSFLHQKKILELGAGVGNSGLLIAAHKLINPTSITLTDFAPSVLQNLQSNIDRYHQQKEKELQLGKNIVNATQVNSAFYLDWSLVDTMEITEEVSGVDVVLAADCTYDENLCVHLASTLRRILLTSKALCKKVDSVSFDQNHISIFNRYPYALIACTVRNEETLSVFLRRLQNIGAFVQDVTWVVIDQQEFEGFDDCAHDKSENFISTDIKEHLVYPTHYLNTFSEKEIRSSIRVIYVSFDN